MAHPTRAFILLCIVLMASEAHADARQDAEKQFRAGVSLQKVEDFEAAIAAFESSLRLYRTKAALFNLANCQRATHRYPEALATFEQLQSEFESELQEPMLGQVTLQIAELKNLTATLQVEVSEVGASIIVDGKTVGKSPLTSPLRLALGDHELRVELDGFEPRALRVNLAPGAELSKKVSLTPLQPSPAPAPPVIEPPAPAPTPAPASPPLSASSSDSDPTQTSATLKTAGIATAAAGAALLLGGGVTGGWALAIDSRLKSDCVDGHCPEARAGDIERMNSLVTATNVLLAVGSFATAGGVLMLWLNPEDQSSAFVRHFDVVVGSEGVRASMSHRF